MASITVTGRNGLFPVGTSVGLFPRAALPPGNGQPKAPSGPAVISAVVAADGSLTWNDPLVVAEVPYVGYAFVNSEHRSLSVRSSSFVAGTTWKARVAARRAAIGTS